MTSPGRISGAEIKARNGISSLKFLFWDAQIATDSNFRSLYPPGQAWLGIPKAGRIFRRLIPQSQWGNIRSLFSRLSCPLAHLTDSSFSRQKAAEDARTCLRAQREGAGVHKNVNLLYCFWKKKRIQGENSLSWTWIGSYSWVDSLHRPPPLLKNGRPLNLYQRKHFTSAHPPENEIMM